MSPYHDATSACTATWCMPCACGQRRESPFTPRVLLLQCKPASPHKVDTIITTFQIGKLRLRKVMWLVQGQRWQAMGPGCEPGAGLLAFGQQCGPSALAAPCREQRWGASAQPWGPALAGPLLSSVSAQTLEEQAGCRGLSWVGVAVAPSAGPSDVLDSVTDLCEAAASLSFLIRGGWGCVPCSAEGVRNEGPRQGLAHRSSLRTVSVPGPGTS